MNEFLQREVEEFDRLPMRCKEMFFECLNDYSFPHETLTICCIPDKECNSPIEKIFYMSMNIVIIKYGIDMYLIPQYEVVTDTKKYITDFTFLYRESGSNEDYSETNIIVECDGHNYHKRTKEQISYENNRELEIKNKGYDIIHFSGSQIYNNPYGCAERTIDYILNKMR